MKIKRLLLLSVLFLSFFNAMAQIEVESFRPLTNDMTAKSLKGTKHDQNGNDHFNHGYFDDLLNGIRDEVHDDTGEIQDNKSHTHYHADLFIQIQQDNDHGRNQIREW